MEVKVNETVLPGDKVVELTGLRNQDIRKIVLGPGLQRLSDSVVVTRAGILRSPRPSIFYVSGYQKRYIPAEGDEVVGIVANKGGDIFRIDIGASEFASLSYLNFENATKKNRPDIQVGDTLYARVLHAGRNVEVEVTCVDRYGKAGDLGRMRDGGFLVHASINLVRKIRSRSCPLIKKLGEYFKFDFACGMNGFLWLCAVSTQQTILIKSHILEAEFMTREEIENKCKEMSTKNYHNIK